MNKLNFVFLFFLSISCTNNAKECVRFFESSDTITSPIGKNVFVIKPLFKKLDSCVYYHKFNSWKGLFKNDSFRSSFSIEGSIAKENDKILLRPKNSFSSFIYFDFGMRSNDSIEINFNFDHNDFGGNKVYKHKEYILKLVSKKFDTELRDTIFDFKFQNFGFAFKNDNLDVLIGRRVGVVGMYVYTTNEVNERCIYSTIGNVFGLDTLRYKCGDYY